MRRCGRAGRAAAWGASSERRAHLDALHIDHGVHDSGGSSRGAARSHNVEGAQRRAWLDRPLVQFWFCDRFSSRWRSPESCSKF